MVRAADQLCLVATGDDGAILGIGLLSKAGEIKLNYVSPDARFHGVSMALIRAMEAEAKSLGISRITLNSTATAHRFYLARGYLDEGPPQMDRLKNGIYPMAKRLTDGPDRK
jgi:GNAT superfamily N-acetyltransferase